MDVILAEHTGLKELRVLKRIGKTTDTRISDAAFQLHREAEILTGLKAPGIPLIYDFWEDDEEICLIEEYVQGISLQEYLLRNGSVDFKFITDILIRISDIMVYLHGQRIPIRHQDLKPEHVIIKGDRVILIDYGIATLLRGGQKDVTGVDDMEALASMAEELACHCSTYIPSWFRSALRKAKSKDDSARYSSVAQWRELLAGQQARNTEKKGLLIRKIAVVGNERGVGATHTAFSLTTYLNYTGKNTCYANQTGRPFLIRMNENLSRDFYEKNGIIYHRWFRGKPDYGPAVETQTTDEEMLVCDCGTDFLKAADADLTIYVTGSRPWQSRQLMEEMLEKDSTVLLMTPANPGMAVALARSAGHRVISLPYQENPLFPDRGVMKVYDEIFKRFEKKGHI
ncbi:MAG: serine/threonine protein kinase [Candidatus Weimeria sp.]